MIDLGLAQRANDPCVMVTIAIQPGFGESCRIAWPWTSAMGACAASPTPYPASGPSVHVWGRRFLRRGEWIEGDAGCRARLCRRAGASRAAGFVFSSSPSLSGVRHPRCSGVASDERVWRGCSSCRWGCCWRSWWGSRSPRPASGSGSSPSPSSRLPASSSSGA